MLNHLVPNVDDIGGMEYQDNWRRLLPMVEVIRAPAGRVALSSHNWWLLGELAFDPGSGSLFLLHDVDVWVVMMLEDVEDSERLEMWMLVIRPSFDMEFDVRMEDMKDMTQVTRATTVSSPEVRIVK